MKILIVDDNQLHLKMCRIMLHNLGHDVVSADSLANVKKMKENSAEIVLIDYRLHPGETGVDVLEFLKGQKGWEDTVFMALTADVGERTQLENAGFDRVVFKPITETLLREIIR